MPDTKVILVSATMDIDLEAYFEVPAHWDDDKCMAYGKEQDGGLFKDKGYLTGEWSVYQTDVIEEPADLKDVGVYAWSFNEESK